MRSIIFFMAMLLVVGCTTTRSSQNDEISPVDLDSIVRRGKLYVMTDYNSVNYFYYKGVAVGYQYELVKEYAKHLGVEAVFVTSNDHELNREKLFEGEVDILANSIIVDTLSGNNIVFTEPYGRSKIVLVQRKVGREVVVDSLAKLSGDTIGVLDNSFYKQIIENIDDSLNLNIVIQPIEYYDIEQLIQLVSENEIKYTLSLENIAKANRWYYLNLDIEYPITKEYDLSWGIRPTSVALKNDIDTWLSVFKKTSRFKQIYRKYNIDPRDHHGTGQNTSIDTYRNDYENIVKAEATDEVYNWKLVSSIIYQESHFNPTARSWAGACGLMQLMPETAKRFGVEDPTVPEQNIKAGVKFIHWLDMRLQSYVPNTEERVKFTLAAYNVGLGHIMDAMRLAEKLGLNKQVWEKNVEVALLHKANPAFYSDPVVKHGYCRGSETVNYVKCIMERYKSYMQLPSE
jgi:membrane-bound lytic murein transglycosylase F